MRQITNISDITSPGSYFVKGPDGALWRDFSGLPANAIERLIRKPRISRLRAAWMGVAASRGSPIISHLPRMTAAVSQAQSIQRNRSAHMAFSFNFTDIPVGSDFERLKKSFARVNQFCVFSAFEKHFYPRYFKLAEDRFICLPWAQSVPEIGVSNTGIPPKTYVSAVGGEGRDYGSLLAAARKLPNIKFVLVARPHNITESVPANVMLLTNVESKQTWRIVKDSSCLIVPLKSATTCCGHITIVSGAQLGVPMISSRSEATTEYTRGVALYEPGDVARLAELIEDYHWNWESRTRQAVDQAADTLRMYNRDQWEAPIAQFVEQAWRNRGAD